MHYEKLLEIGQKSRQKYASPQKNARNLQNFSDFLLILADFARSSMVVTSRREVRGRAEHEPPPQGAGHREPAGAAQPGRRPARVAWAANKRFEVLKFKFKFPRARTFELYRARSRLYKFRRASPSARLWLNLSSQ